MFNRSRTTQVNDNSTVQLDLADSTGSQAAVLHSSPGATVNMLDNKAIARALDFAQASQGASLDLAKNISTSSASLMRQGMEAVAASSRAETENVMLSLQKYAIYAAMIWGAVTVVKGMSK